MGKYVPLSPPSSTLQPYSQKWTLKKLNNRGRKGTNVDMITSYVMIYKFFLRYRVYIF